MPKRTRKADYTEAELEVLIDAFIKKNDVISSKFSDDITLKKKREAYAEIARCVNAIGGNERSVENIKEKWQSMKSLVKKKAASFYSQQSKSRNKTGGGELEDLSSIDEHLSPSERRILVAIPPELYEGKLFIY